MRVGIFGGTFDPPHIGHLLVASDAAEALSLDVVTFVPTAIQPLKGTSTTTAPEHRLAMVERLVSGDPRFRVDRVEIDRAGISFTVDTLTHFAASRPDDERFLLVGADVLESFASWHQPERVSELAQLAVLARERFEVPSPWQFGRAPIVLQTRRVDISSTEIRARVRAGRPIRGFVTDGVAELIASAGLYR